MQIRLQWSINRNVPSSNGIKNLRGCGFQTEGLHSVDDNERWESVGFCKHACLKNSYIHKKIYTTTTSKKEM